MRSTAVSTDFLLTRKKLTLYRGFSENVFRNALSALCRWLHFYTVWCCCLMGLGVVAHREAATVLNQLHPTLWRPIDGSVRRLYTGDVNKT
jgi:hypothetical protein